jgi:hypothetical protein
LSPRDHWEIIGQTSVYGLPALRRIAEPEDEAKQGDPDVAVKKVFRGGVVRPDKEYDYLKEVDAYLAAQVRPVPSPPPQETGVALATPFETADVTLTSLGATMRLEWRGEPALLKSTHDVPLPNKSFSLERLAYQTWLGPGRAGDRRQQGLSAAHRHPGCLRNLVRACFPPGRLGAGGEGDHPPLHRHSDHAQAVSGDQPAGRRAGLSRLYSKVPHSQDARI